jgi:hypothetical protein
MYPGLPTFTEEGGRGSRSEGREYISNRYKPESRFLFWEEGGSSPSAFPFVPPGKLPSYQPTENTYQAGPDNTVPTLMGEEKKTP